MLKIFPGSNPEFVNFKSSVPTSKPRLPSNYHFLKMHSKGFCVQQIGQHNNVYCLQMILRSQPKKLNIIPMSVIHLSATLIQRRLRRAVLMDFLSQRPTFQKHSNKIILFSSYHQSVVKKRQLADHSLNKKSLPSTNDCF